MSPEPHETTNRRRVVVRYKLKADRVAEHEALLRKVFEQLTERAPAGLVYEAMKLSDGVSFVHVATLTTDDNPLLRLEAFKAFTADVGARCEDPPVSSPATIMGAYAAVS
jgi:hypothetical protein